MKRYAFAGVWWLAAATLAHAQGFSGTPSANQIFAGPTSGPAKPGQFRSMVNGDLPQQNANTWKGNATGSAAAPSDNAWTNCNGANSAVNYTNGTGTGCNSNVASLNTNDQTLAGGANVTSLSLGTVSSGTTTIDCGARPTQFLTDNGAFTLAAPANDGSCIVQVTNGASAGSITFSGFSVGANTGDALTTTNTQKFSIFIWRVNGVAGYRVAAHQ